MAHSSNHSLQVTMLTTVTKVTILSKVTIAGIGLVVRSVTKVKLVTLATKVAKNVLRLSCKVSAIFVGFPKS